MTWNQLIETLMVTKNLFVSGFTNIIYSELILNLVFLFFGMLLSYFVLNSFFVWLDELLFGKSRVEIIQNKIKLAHSDTVNSELGNFTILYLKNSVGRFIIFKDVFYETDPTKVVLRFSTSMLKDVKQNQNYYSFVVLNSSTGIRKLKNSEIKFESKKRIFYDNNCQRNVKDVNCGGYESHGFCNVKLNDLGQGQEATFNIVGTDVKVPQYSDSTKIRPELKIKTYESHIKPLLNKENMIHVGGLEIPLPKDDVEESSIFMLINNPVEWVPLNLSADKSVKAIECKIFKSKENFIQNKGGTWFDLVITNHMMVSCKEINIAADFGKYKVKEVYFHSEDLSQKDLIRTKPDKSTFFMVLANTKPQTAQVIKILSEGNDFKSLKITSDVLKEDIIIKGLAKVK